MKTFTEKKAVNTSKVKLPYRASALKNYGSLVELTKGGTLFGNDGNNNCTGNSNAAEEPCALS